MKKTLLSVIVIGMFAVYAFLQRQAGGQTAFPVSSPGSSGGGTAPTPEPTGMAAPTGSVAGGTPPTNGQYRDGTYTGNSADAFYGNVQVRATIRNGKITDVQFLDYPHDRRTSEMINSQAMPILSQEAIQLQTATVDAVSGATQTSRAFVESLGNALSQAQ